MKWLALKRQAVKSQVSQGENNGISRNWGLDRASGKVTNKSESTLAKLQAIAEKRVGPKRRGRRAMLLQSGCMAESMLSQNEINPYRLAPVNCKGEQWVVERVLLICGEDLTRRMLKVVLEVAGYQVMEAVSLPSAMREVATYPQGVHLAVVVGALEGGLWASIELLRSAMHGSPLLVMSPSEVTSTLDDLERLHVWEHEFGLLGRIRDLLDEHCFQKQTQAAA